MAPNSYPGFREGFTQEFFDDITAQEIVAPITRDLLEGKFDLKSTITEIATRRSNTVEGDKTLSE